MAELLTIAGGPIMWTVYKRAQVIYDRYRERQLQSIMDSVDQASLIDGSKKSGQQIEKVRSVFIDKLSGLWYLSPVVASGKDDLNLDNI